MKLRDYQLECLQVIWEKLFIKNHVLVVMGTGSGKTEVFIELIRKALATDNKRIMVLVNKVSLVEQTIRRINTALGLDTAKGFCASYGEKSSDSQLTVASIQSIHKEDVDKVHLLIIDESHRYMNTETATYKKFVDHLKSKNDKLKIVGFTATPFRDTGYIYGAGELFDTVDYKLSLSELVARGYLAAPRLKHVEHQFKTDDLKIVAGDYSQKQLDLLVQDKTIVKEQIADALARIRLNDRKHCAWVCVNIEHATEVASILEKSYETVSLVHSKQHKHFNDSNVKAFENKETKHLVFVTMLSEGVDIPIIDCIVFMRPTRSPTLYVQVAGRALRLAPGKTDALILDYGRVVENLGPLDNPVVKEKGKKFKPDDTMKFCVNCMEYIDRMLERCPACDWIFKPPAPVERDVLKNLSTRADNTSSLTEMAIKNMKVGALTFSEYVSRSKNKCFRIIYVPTGNVFERMMNSKTVAEYFVLNNSYAIDRLKERLAMLGIDAPDLAQDLRRGHLDELIKHCQRDARTPDSVDYIVDRYVKVVKLYMHARQEVRSADST